MATPLARKHFGYDGPEDEASLIAAANRIVDVDRLDVVARIKAVDWPLGDIIRIAQAKGYCKILSFKGWCATHLRCSDTHAYQCGKAWDDHNDFDPALEWLRGLNNGWVPKCNTGPGFQNELIKAWRAWKKGENPFVAKPNGKTGQSAKVLNELRKEAETLAGNYKTWYERLKVDYLKIVEIAQVEPVVLNQIEHERRAQEGDGEPEITNPSLGSGIETDDEAPMYPRPPGYYGTQDDYTEIRTSLAQGIEDGYLEPFPFPLHPITGKEITKPALGSGSEAKEAPILPAVDDVAEPLPSPLPPLDPPAPASPKRKRLTASERVLVAIDAKDEAKRPPKAKGARITTVLGAVLAQAKAEGEAKRQTKTKGKTKPARSGSLNPLGFYPSDAVKSVSPKKRGGKGTR